MQVFNVYYRLIKKQLPIIFLYILGFIIIMSYESKEMNKSQSIYQMPIIAYWNQENNAMVEESLVPYLANYYDMVALNQNLTNLVNDYNQILSGKDIAFTLTIPKDFSEKLRTMDSGIVEIDMVSENSHVEVLQKLINTYFDKYKNIYHSNPKIADEELYAVLKEELESEVEIILNFSNTSYVMKDYYKRYYNISSYIIVAILMFIVSTVIGIFQDKDIKRRMLISLVMDRQVNGQILLGNSLLTLCLSLSFFIISLVIIPHGGYTKLNGIYFINFMLFSLTALSFSYFISLWFLKSGKYRVFVFALPFLLAVISGSLFPIHNFHYATKIIASFTPLYWYAKSNDIIGFAYNYNWDKSNILYYMVIQVLFILVYLVYSLIILKNMKLKD